MRRATPRWLRGLGVFLGLLAGGASSHAAQCTVSTTSVAFGAYDPFSTAPKDSNGSVQITCDVVTGYTIALNAGTSGSLNRAMASGAYRLNYNLFTEATGTIVWGDGSGAGTLVSGSGTAATIPVYGRVPARQNVRAGSYVDTLIMTVTY
jgi:spore coat protein U-like protein